MTEERNTNVLAARAAFVRTTDDREYINFLNVLSLEELETYFYIEANRSNMMIEQLSTINGKTVTLDDLREPSMMKFLPEGLGLMDDAVRSLIIFWDMFGKLTSPALELRQAVIEKFSSSYREMPPEEVEFFESC